MNEGMMAMIWFKESGSKLILHGRFLHHVS
jgi:hypothetical protein